MSNLKSIVPPPDLCKQIPVGEFEDSALAWYYNFRGVPILRWRNNLEKLDGVRPIPAPTLEETMTSLLNYAGWLLKIDSRFGLETFVELYSRTSNKHYTEYDPSACAAALRLWFKVKGIEVE